MRAGAWMALLLVAAALTGCIGGDEASDLTPAAIEPPNASTNTSEPTYELEERRFVWEGDTDLVACGHGRFEGCIWPNQWVNILSLGFIPWEGPFYQRQVSGLASPVEVNVTWAPESPLTEELVVVGTLEIPSDTEDGWEHLEVARAVGTSPLALSLEAPSKQPRAMGLVVYPASTLIPGVSASIEQPLHVEGSYHVLQEALP